MGRARKSHEEDAVTVVAATELSELVNCSLCLSLSLSLSFSRSLSPPAGILRTTPSLLREPSVVQHAWFCMGSVLISHYISIN